MARNYGPPPERGREHELLNMFVGTWHAEGQSFGENQDRQQPRANGLPWRSDEVTAWHPGGFFLVQQEIALAGSGALITHSVIAYDAEAGHYVAHAFENHGYYRKYDVAVEGRVWTFGASLERARIEFDADHRQQSVSWEWRPEGDEWLPLCERVNKRIA
jgi:hypothetical protein